MSGDSTEPGPFLVPLPPNEIERLRALRAIGILDTGPDAAFDRLTRLAASLFGTTYAFVSYVDLTRQWFKSSRGFTQSETTREEAFCSYTILRDGAMVVPDTLMDERFRDNPLVHEGLKLRFYAGAPVVSPDGHKIGTFCVADTQPRTGFSERETHALETLAAIVSEMTAAHGERRESVSQEQEVRDRYALVASATSDGVWDWEVASGQMYFSPRWQELLGLGGRECLATLDHWIQRVHPEDRPAVMREIDLQMEGQEAPFRSEHRVRHGDGSWRWVVVRGLSQRDASGQVRRMAGSLMDVTIDKTLDRLTQLPNGLMVQDRLLGLITRSEAAGSWHFALLLLDVDDFKAINEQYGHRAGDDVLMKVAERASSLIAHTRENEGSLVARLTGDEFVVLVDGVQNTRQAEQVARRLREAIASPIDMGKDSLKPRVSIGVAMGGPEFNTAELLLHNADLAMLQAKALGGDATVVFNPSMTAENLQRLRNETLLRRAVGAGQMRLFYQPQVDLQTGELVGCEALVRWQHPELGLVAPDTFIPLAERMGVIGELDLWVLKTATAQIARWRKNFAAARHWHMSVNVSAEKFPNPRLLRDVEETLRSHDLPPSVLCMEITETALMRQLGSGAQAMHALREIGVGLHMDDFGAGYSSMKQLYDLPFDTLKIDRSFLNSIVDNEKAVNVVRGILSLAQTLGLRSIAEGIETQEQEALLRSLGCELGQGYFYSRPIDGESFARRYLETAEAGKRDLVAFV